MRIGGFFPRLHLVRSPWNMAETLHRTMVAHTPCVGIWLSPRIFHAIRNSPSTRTRPLSNRDQVWLATALPFARTKHCRASPGSPGRRVTILNSFCGRTHSASSKPSAVSGMMPPTSRSSPPWPARKSTSAMSAISVLKEKRPAACRRYSWAAVTPPSI